MRSLASPSTWSSRCWQAKVLGEGLGGITRRDPGNDAAWFAIAAAIVLPLILAGTAADHAAICR